MYCPKCGAEIDDSAVICPRCGVPVTGKPAADDKPSGGLAVLGFFFPLIGLILYLVWHSEKPQKAKSCGKGALIGVIVQVIIGVIYGIFVASFIGAALM